MNIGDNLRHQFVRLSYSPEIMSMEFTREEMITIYDYIKSKEEEIERLNNIINELDKLIEQYSKNDYYYKYNGKYLKSEIINDLKTIRGVDKE